MKTAVQLEGAAHDNIEVTAPRLGRWEKTARFAQRNGALLVLVLLCGIMSFVFPSFGTASNLAQIAQQASFYSLLALGMTLVIFTGGIDLSVGSVFALSGVLAAWASQFGIIPALLVPLAVCGLFGLIQGLIISRAGVPPFIVTLAGLLFARGLLLSLTQEGSVTFQVPQESGFLSFARGGFLGIGFTVWVALLLFAIGMVVQYRTSFGATLLAIGGQPGAADLMGLPVARAKISAYVASAMLAGFAGVLTASYTGAGVTTLGVGLELTAISAVVLGGTALMGGSGSILGTLIGMLLLQVIANLINRLGLTDSNWQATVNGAVLIVVATAQIYLSRVQKRSRKAIG